jgi:sulfatase modifying factor 1
MFRVRLPLILLLCCFSQSAGNAQEPLVVDLGEGVSIDLVRIPNGKFSQGSPETEQGREVDEIVRNVVLSHDFFIGTTPVTVGQFRRFVAATNYKTEAESGPSGGYGVVNGELVQQPQFNWKNPGYSQTDDHPVTIVTLADASAFLKWLSNKSGRTMVLPTEAQWEYACRAGSTSRFYNGDDDAAMDAIGWSQKNAPSSPMPVKQKGANAFGLYDMSGNVYEWCQDIYSLYPADSVSDPLQLQGQPGEKVRNVLRGGSWMRFPKRCRSAARYRATPGTRNAENGFRVVTMDLQVLAVSAKVNAQPPVTENSPPPIAEPTPNVAAGESASFVDQRPSVSPESPSSRGGFFFFIAFMAFLAWLGRKIYRALAIVEPETLSMTPEPRSDLRPDLPRQIDGFALRMMAGLLQTEKDGFWFSTEEYSIGTMLQCEYWADKKLFNETVEVTSPVKQFVYTGSPPTDIKISVANSVSRPGDLNAPYPTESWTSGTEPTPSRNNPQTYVFVDPVNTARSRSDRGDNDSQPETTTSPGVGFPPAY